ncbi:GNAT family N-acetyltransferase [Longispora sp. NPDC051575]|uniref:GNAT family N-acetyltransferase n=1 Tax=Longispora sp. NPDC051575 TaxID=3154943 RepID=UPI00342D532B
MADAVDVVTVRRLGPGDWELTRRLRLAALLDAPDAFGGTYADTLARPEEQWRSWPGGGPVFAAERDGLPVGLVCGFPHPDGRAELISMWVAPGARGRRVAARLIDAVADWARESGAEALELHVYPHNQAAYQAYARYGFTDQEVADEILMRLPLR